MGYACFVKGLTFDLKTKFGVERTSLSLRIEHRTVIAGLLGIRERTDHQHPANTGIAVFGQNGNPFQFDLPIV